VTKSEARRALRPWVMDTTRRTITYADGSVFVNTGMPVKVRLNHAGRSVYEVEIRRGDGRTCQGTLDDVYGKDGDGS
jgi:hypothetical protein